MESNDSTKHKSKAEVLAEIKSKFDEKHSKASQLLINIRENRERIRSLLDSFNSSEPDLIYRFYHQSFKVFGMTNLIRQANKLFSDIAPDQSFLNPWYAEISRSGLRKEFKGSYTNQNWQNETLPIMQAFWHAKYFLEQMAASADELRDAPMILPSGWAAVLYLYRLR